MGIATGGAKLILQEASRRPFEGSVLTLGKQNVFFTHADLAAMAAEFGLRLDPRIEPVLSSDPAYARNGFISDVTLFRSLGAENCFSLDCSDFEGSEFVFDLNRNDLPEGLVNRFDLIPVPAPPVQHPAPAPRPVVRLARGLLAPCPPVYRLARRIYRSLRGRPFVPEPSAVVPKVLERSSKSLRLKAVARY